jgi:probable rRNA maturation factor
VVHSQQAVEVTVQDYFFASRQADPPVSAETWEQWFCQWLAHLEAELPAASGYELSLRLTDDAEIQDLNAQYCDKNLPTDVLAFAALEVDYPQLEEPDDEEAASLYLGDIVISVETAGRQAAQSGHTLNQELAWLASHALLHLLGWDHPDQASMLCMVKQQKTLLQTVGVSIDYYQVEKQIQQAYFDTEPCNV